jgi:hypothetical protein
MPDEYPGPADRLDRPKGGTSYVPLVLAAIAILGIAAVAAITTNESEKQVERAAVHQDEDRR